MEGIFFARKKVRIGVRLRQISVNFVKKLFVFAAFCSVFFVFCKTRLLKKRRKRAIRFWGDDIQAKKEPHLHLKWGAEKFAAYRMLGYAQRLYAERAAEPLISFPLYYL